MHSLSYILDKSARSDQVTAMSCQDFFKDFDLDILKAVREFTEVTESDYVESSPNRP